MKIRSLLTGVNSMVCTVLLTATSSLCAAQTPSANNMARLPLFSDPQTQAIQTIIHQYLVQHPEVLLEASNALRAKMEQEQEGKAVTAIKAEKNALLNDPQTPFIGNPKGTQIIIEFMDYQCAHCKDMNNTIKNLIQKNPNLKIILRDWPIFEGASLTGAKAAIAANKQGKYFALHEALLSAPNPLTDEKIFTIAKQIGLNVDQLKKDMESTSITDQIKANYDLAGKIGLAGTPAFIITHSTADDVKFIPGATTEDKLQALLEQPGPTAAPMQ